MTTIITVGGPVAGQRITEPGHPRDWPVKTFAYLKTPPIPVVHKAADPMGMVESIRVTYTRRHIQMAAGIVYFWAHEELTDLEAVKELLNGYRPAETEES